jgi:hypothetical protein
MFVKVHRGQYRLIPSDQPMPHRKKLVNFIREKVSSVEEASMPVCTTDYFNFLDLVERMLMYSVEERMTPDEALRHAFFRLISNQSMQTELTSIKT